MSRRIATAFAPASVANLAVGFDVLGFAVGVVGDRIRVRLDPNTAGVRVGAVSGLVPRLPTDPARNTATVALAAMAAECRFDAGLVVDIHKGIPLGSGMGGSAASAVGAVVAANALLAAPLEPSELLAYAVAGEAVASGGSHADNVAPALLGGLVAVVSAEPLEVVKIPVPEELRCVLVHPHLEVETRAARAALNADLSLATHVTQTQAFAGFLAGLYTGDLELVGRSMVDRVAGPSRASMIPGFGAAKKVALEAGALGFAVSGAGPSVFAFVGDDAVGEAVRTAVVDAFAAVGSPCESWVSRVGTAGAQVLEPDDSFLADEGA